MGTKLFLLTRQQVLKPTLIGKDYLVELLVKRNLLDICLRLLPVMISL